MSDLTPKQRLFCQEYLVDLNATQAAIRAGYSAKTAAEQGYDLLRKPQIQEFIQAARTQREQKTKINAEYVLRGAAELFERCMQKVPVMVYDKEAKEYFQATQIVHDPDTGEVQERGVWKFDSTGAAAALNILGKHVDIQAFRERHQVELKATLEHLVAGSGAEAPK